MKTLLFALSLAAAGVSTSSAQIYAPAVVNGSVLGGIAGALIGGHNHNRWGEGALIGAAAGALLGSAVEQPRRVVYQQPPVTVMQSVPQAQLVPDAPTFSQGYAPQVVYVQQAPQVVYVQQPAQVYYAPCAPAAYYDYPAPVVGVGFGYSWGRGGYYGHGRRHW